MTARISTSHTSAARTSTTARTRRGALAAVLVAAGCAASIAHAQSVDVI